MAKALARKPVRKGGPKTSGNVLRLGDLETRVRGMNIAVAAAREYLKAYRRPRILTEHVARLVDAQLSLMRRRIMVIVRRLEREGYRNEAETAFREGTESIGLAAAKEFVAKDN